MSAPELEILEICFRLNARGRSSREIAKVVPWSHTSVVNKMREHRAACGGCDVCGAEPSPAGAPSAPRGAEAPESTESTGTGDDAVAGYTPPTPEQLATMTIDRLDRELKHVEKLAEGARLSKPPDLKGYNMLANTMGNLSARVTALRKAAPPDPGADPKVLRSGARAAERLRRYLEDAIDGRR